MIAWELVLNDRNNLSVLKLIEHIKEKAIANKDLRPQDANISLFNGQLGVALFLFNYSNLTGKEPEKKIALELIEESLYYLEGERNHWGLCRGMAGVIWLMENLKNEIEFDIPLDGITNNMFEIGLQQIEGDFFDYLYGGSGVIFSVHNSIRHNPLKLKRLHQTLISKADIKKDLIRWPCKHQFNLKDKIEYNMGLAHGMLSILNLYLLLYDDFIPLIDIKSLLAKSTNWVLKQEQQNEISLFPYLGDSNLKPNSSRLGWCYGDIPIAFLLIRSGIALDDQNLIDKSLRIIQHSMNRRIERETSVANAGFCHGSAGIAHLYLRYYNTYNKHIDTSTKAQLIETINFWSTMTINFADWTLKISPFKAYFENKGWTENIGMLEGSAGIGLALISQISQRIPTWDNVFFLDNLI